MGLVCNINKLRCMYAILKSAGVLDERSTFVWSSVIVHAFFQLITRELVHAEIHDVDSGDQRSTNSTQSTVTSSVIADQATSNDKSSCQVPYIHCRLLNFEPVTPLKNMKANYFGVLKFAT